MKRWIAARLQRRFVLVSAGLMAGASLLFLMILLGLHTRLLLEENRRASLALNGLLQASLENAMLNRDLDGLNAIVSRLAAQEQVAQVMIVNTQGEIRFASDPGLVTQPFSDPEFAEILHGGQPVAVFRQSGQGGDLLRSINPVPNQAACISCHGSVEEAPVNGLLVVDYLAIPMARNALRGTFMLIGMGLVVMALLAVGLWVSLRHLVLRRLERLGRTVQRLGEGQAEQRAEIDGEDEIAGLARGFNDMASSLDQAGARLRAAHHMLDSILDASPDGIRVIGPDFRILHANTAYAAQLGVAPGSVVGQPCHRSSHNRTRPCETTLQNCPVEQVIHAGAAATKFTDSHVGAGGRRLNVEVTAAPVTMMVDGDATRCVVEVIRNLDSEAQISHGQRLAEIGLLINGVAHEINTPLNSIILALDGIRRRATEAPGVDRYLAIAEAEIESCIKFTDSLLKLGQPSHAQFGLVDMVGLTEDILTLVRGDLEAAGIEVTRDFQSPAVVRASDSDMRVLVLNLVVNAMHAMAGRGGGSLVIVLREVGTHVCLSLSDTGVGIRPENLEKIFLPFWTDRGDGTRGRGLGLAICRQVLDRLGGEISVDSRVGEGTRFTLHLPGARHKPETGT